MGNLKINGGLEVYNGTFKITPLTRLTNVVSFPAFIDNDSSKGMGYMLASDMSVGYATSAGNADTVDGYHHSSFLKTTGGSLSGALTINSYLQVGSGDSSYIAFRGTTGDNPGGYNHTFIGERLYGGSESSELLLFKGNDNSTASGPDRIRHVAASHLFQTYVDYIDTATLTSFEAIATSTQPVTRMEINNSGVVISGTCTATSFIGTVSDADKLDGYHAGSFLLKSGDTATGNLIAPTYIATQKMVVSATGLVDLTAAGTTRLYADGIAISNPATKNDDAWIRVTGTGESDTILEIATGDDGGGTASTGPEQIIVRQYGSSGIANSLTLLDVNGNTSTSKWITARGFSSAQGYYSGQNGSEGLVILDPNITNYSNVGGSTADNDDYRTKLLQKISQVSRDATGATLIGRYWPNSYGFLYGNVYNTAAVNSSGLPQYSTLLGSNLGGTMYIFGTVDYNRYNYTILHSGNYSSYCAPASHSHGYLPLSGGTMSGPLNFANGTWNILGDDVRFGDQNAAGTFVIEGLNGDTTLQFNQYGSSNKGTICIHNNDFHFNTWCHIPTMVLFNSYGGSLPSGYHYGQVFFLTT